MARYKVLDKKNLPEGTMRQVIVEGIKIVLIAGSEGFYAYEDQCAHVGAPLSLGRLSGNELTCSAHWWQYDIKTGVGINPSHCQLKKYEVTVVDEDVYIDV